MGAAARRDLGWGLSANIKQGYRWLAERYEGGDEVFVLGFSRGAYTARSLVGLVRKCGLLRAEKLGRLAEAYELYRDKAAHPDGVEAAGFRAANAREVRVKFVGVWDTVGALGLPASFVPFGRDYYTWHDTELSGIVDYAYHALALDEHRADFAPAVWTGRLKPGNRRVEQRWFVGAHSNVGGGIPADPLARLPLRWLQRKAAECGLALTGEAEVGPGDQLAEIDDSFAEFLYGLYRLYKLGRRRHRQIGAGVNEVVDESVARRYEADADYRPPLAQECFVGGRAFASGAGGGR